MKESKSSDNYVKENISCENGVGGERVNYILETAKLCHCIDAPWFLRSVSLV